MNQKLSDPKAPGVMIYFDIIPLLASLTDEEKGQLFTTVLHYGETGEVAKMERILRPIFEIIRAKIDRDQQRYTDITFRNRANGKKGGRPPNQKKVPETWAEAFPSTPE